MIQLDSDCLFFKTPDGELFPCSAEVASVELVGEAKWLLDPELVQNAAEAVLYYFRHELGRDTVSVGEFSETLQKVLSRLGLDAQAEVTSQAPEPETDLQSLAQAAGKGFELAFFMRLREELHRHLATAPQKVRFTGLQGSVKTLLGARRWNERCRQLSDQIVAHLRQCFLAEGVEADCTLMVR
jgi:hypothetical protein